MEEKKKYTIPQPIIDSKESTSLEVLTARYQKLLEPSKLSQAGKQIGQKVGDLIPTQVKDMASDVAHSISESEVYLQAMKLIVETFDLLEKQVAKFLINEKAIISLVNKAVPDYQITNLSEICFARGYEVSKLVNAYRTVDFCLALAEGGVTGFFGFKGIAANIVLSTLLNYNAVQTVAMFYGYDVKHDPAELVIASEVFSIALSKGEIGNSEVSGIIAKIMIFSETTGVKQAATKTWTDLAARGGIGLLLTKLRALANVHAKKALEKVGAKSLENNLFHEVFEQIGKRLTKDAVRKKAMPGLSAIVGAGVDGAQLNSILEFADVFYNKRFLLEKEARILSLTGCVDDVIDADPTN